MAEMVRAQESANFFLADLLLEMREITGLMLAQQQQSKRDDRPDFMEAFGGNLSRVVRDLPEFTSDLPDGRGVPEPVATPSKDELCRRHFEEHPEDRKRTGRDLQDSVHPMGVRISYVTWNKVKQGLEK